MPCSKIEKVAHVALNVADPAASAAWYCDILGMEVVAVAQIGYFLSFGGQHHDVALIQAAPGAEHGGLGIHHVAFQIVGDEADLARLYGGLLKKGVRIHRVADHAVGKGVYFYDPDGNRLEFFLNQASGRDGIELFREAKAPSDTYELDPIFE